MRRSGAGSASSVADEDRTPFDQLLTAMKTGAAALRDAGIPFMLAGGLASWARGGPPTEHDVDFMVKPDDLDRAGDVLGTAGFRIEQPPEEWLRKAYMGDALVDLIHTPVGIPVDDEMLGRAEELEVQAVSMPVMSADDLIVTKVLALSEHNADFESVLEVGRSLREQIDWSAVRERTSGSPFGKAYLVLAEELGLVQAVPS
jgi:predicted nucleotidyltransferase